MADDVEIFIFSPVQLASQKSEFFEELYFRRRVCNGGLQFGFKHGGRVIVTGLLEFTALSTDNISAEFKNPLLLQAD